MISGALLLDPGKNESSKTFYQKRMSRVLLPLAFWSVFYVLWSPVRAHVKSEPLSLAQIAHDKLLVDAPYYHMWFMYMIVFLYLFTPFLRKIVSASSRTDIAILTALAFMVAALDAVGTEFGTSGVCLFSNLLHPFIPYFFLGHLVRTSACPYFSPALWGLFCLSVLLTAAGFHVFASNSGFYYFYNYLSLTVIPMSYSIVHLLKRWNTPIGSEGLTRQMSSLVLGVYLMHPVFLDIMLYTGYGP